MGTRKIFPLRLRAAAIDFLIVVAFGAIMIGVAVIKNLSPWFVIAAILIFSLIYAILTELLFSATIGMKIIKLTLSNTDGNKPGIVKIILRNLFMTLTCLPLGFGFLYCLIDSDRKTIYDYATNTSIVGVKRKGSAKKSKALIVGTGNKFKNEQFSIENGILLGRDPTSCSVVFNTDEPAVSRMHCCLRYNRQTKMVILEDIGSTYGTFLWNGKKINKGQAAALSNGDKFYLANKANSFKVVIKD